ncbi:MAG: AsmA family protein [Nitrospirota bacterium]|nr:AsmA family protein [Nitrospirota bacterium]
MTKRRVIYIVIAAILLLAGAIVFLWTNLDWIVKNAIEKFGSKATNTAVRVRSVSLKPAQGKGAIEGLTVANPPGFESRNLLSLGAVSIKLAPKTVASNPVVIDDIRITAPLVVYEMNESRTSNVDVLKKNLGAPEPAAKKQSEKKAKEPAKRLRIRKLVVENAKVEVRGLEDKPRVLMLRRLEMNDIGGKNGGTPEQVGKEILSEVLGEVSKEVGKAGGAFLLEKGMERLLRRK